MKSRKTAATKKTEPEVNRTVTKKLKPYAENLLAFAFISWLGLSNFDASYNFIDLKVFYITIIGIIYGNRQSITAAALSIGLLLYQNLIDGRELVSLLYDTDFFFQAAVYLFIGLVVGYAIERKNGVIASQEHKVEEISDKYEFLNSVYTEVREVKDELQQRIQNSGDSFGKIYSITKELDSLEPEKIFNSAVSVIESIMGTNAVSIYTVNNYRNYLRLVAHSIGGETRLTKSIKVEDFEYLKRMFAEGAIHINKELNDEIPLMSAPVQNGGETVAVICIDGVQFEKFTLYHQNLFKVTVELVSSALSRAFSYVEATESSRYVEGTTILNKEVFASILESKKLAKEKHRINYLLLSYQGNDISDIDKSVVISKLLRETDYIGVGHDDKVWIMMSNTAPSDAQNVFKRFADKDIALTLMEEEVVYG
nr:GAF domain-containing protein [Paenibacillus sacheonensis]